MLDNFSETQEEARYKFCRAASSLCHPVSYQVTGDYTIDLAVIGASPRNHKVYLDVSGIHGIEGYFGSAVQCASLRALANDESLVTSRITHIFVHAANPWGLKNNRRTNESNVDLNRNFIDFSSIDVAAINPAYAELDSLISPCHRSQVPINFLKLFFRYLSAPEIVRRALTEGQYRNAKGLFYGGAQPSIERQILTDIIDPYRMAEYVSMVDWHTGLGAKGSAELILTSSDGADRVREWFLPHHKISINNPTANNSSIAALTGSVRHILDNWEGNKLTLTHEVKILPPIKVVRALYAANSYDHLDGQPDHKSKLLSMFLGVPITEATVHKAMRQAFYPKDPIWRFQALRSGLETFYAIHQDLKSL